MSKHLNDKNSNNSEKTRYTDEELQEFKQLIEGKLVNARKDLNYYQKQIKDLSSNPSDKASGLEDGTHTSGKEYLNQIASRQIQYINHLENALIRIENKAYGICRTTGKLIGKKRLLAVPHTTLSIHAKMNRPPKNRFNKS